MPGTAFVLSARDIAEYFLTFSEELDSGEGISNLKLQKLLYYAQGYYLAAFDRPLFQDPIEAWTHGPVVTGVYHTYKDFASNPISPPSNFDPEKIPAETRDFLDEVYDIVGQYSAWKLREMTHNEPPWKNTDKGEVIPQSAMRDYFQNLVDDSGA